MQKTTKNKWLTILVVVLVLANIATLVTLWAGKTDKRPAPEKPADFLARTLGFNDSQKTAMLKLVREHQQNADRVRHRIKDAKDRFFDLLGQQAVPDSIRNARAEEANGLVMELDLLTFEHFRKLRALCNENQKTTFDSLLHKMAGMIVRPGPPQGRGPREGPPPPPGE